MHLATNKEVVLLLKLTHFIMLKSQKNYPKFSAENQKKCADCT